MLRREKIWVKPGVVFWHTKKRYFFIDRSLNKYGEIDRNTCELLKLCNGREFSEISRGFAHRTLGKRDVGVLAGSIENLYCKKMITNMDLKKRLLRLNKERTDRMVVFCELTKACNLKCVMCYNNSGNPSKSEMSSENWKLAIKRISMLANCTLVLTGGEPMMRRDIFSIIKYAKERCHSVEMTSNGWFISKKTADTLGNLQVDHIRLSLDGGNEETHDLIRGRKGSFSKVIQATRFLQHAGTSTSWLVTLMRQNVKEIPSIFRLASDIGISRLKFGFAVGIGRATAHANYIVLSPEEELVARQTILQLRQKYARTVSADSGCEGEGDNLSENTRRSFLRNSMCGVGISCFYLTSSGYVTICPLMGSKNFQIGHILRDGVEILREAPVVKKFLATSLEEFDSCKTCGLRYLCLGGCRANAFFLTGSLMGCDRTYRDYVSLLLDHLVEFK